MIQFNEINPDDVRRETMNSKEYLVFPLKPIISMNLHRGYVPEEHVQKSTPDWNGTPLTLNHPTDSEGNPVSANHPDVAEKTWLGHGFNFPHEMQSEPKGEGWLDIEQAKTIGGEAEEIVNRLEDGDPISVSSAYRGDRLPPGEYDGEHRDKVKGNIRPDHIAILPNKQGVCDIDDGCMAGQPAANSELLFPPGDDGSANKHPEHTEEQTSQMDDTLTVNRTIDSISFQETADGALDESELPEDNPDGHYVFSGNSRDDSSFPLVDSEERLRRDNVVFAFNHREHAPDEDRLLSVLRAANSEFDDPPLDDEDFESPDSGFIGDVKSLLGLDKSEPSTNNTMSDQIEFLVNERGYDEENLPPEDSDCFDTLVENEQKLAEIEQNTDDDGGDDDGGADDGALDDVTDTLSEIQEQMVTQDDIEEHVSDAIAANEAQSEKRELAETIVSNSDDYDEDDIDDLVDNSKDVLETLADNVTESTNSVADRRGQIGASASSSSTDDASDWAAPSANAREAELEGDD